ncbi:NADH-quinone oxidoreductase chain 5 [bacterium HR10]|nr:NADH-quinone oxidoreductase chain 5 [bacterium HR10]
MEGQEHQTRRHIFQQRFGPHIVEAKEQWGELTFVIAREALIEICQALRDDPAFDYKMLVDLCGVDRGVGADPRFEVVYHLYSLTHRHRLRLKVRVNEEEAVPSVTGIWPNANWYEREVYDMFGVRFEGHPELRRLLMPEDWEGYPLRKDYPLRGYRG